jgi:hypothetical protein
MIRKMKGYASFDDYLEDQTPKNQVIIRALRKFVKRVQPGLDEAVKWGNGCWIGKNGSVAPLGLTNGRLRRSSNKRCARDRNRRLARPNNPLQSS